MKKNIGQLKEMITIEEIKENLEGLCVLTEEFQNAVIEAFEDYQFNGESYIVVDSLERRTFVDDYGMCEQWTAFANTEDAPEITFQTIENAGEIKIVNVD